MDPDLLTELRTQYDKAVNWGILTNRLWDWPTGPHPGYTLARRLHTRAAQVWRFTLDFAVPFTNSETPDEDRRLLAQRTHRRPLLPRTLLPRHRPQPRRTSPQRRTRRPGRNPLDATPTARSTTGVNGYTVCCKRAGKTCGIASDFREHRGRELGRLVRMTTIHSTVATPIGDLLIVASLDGDRLALRSLTMPGQKVSVDLGVVDDAAFAHVTVQIAEYFAGSRTEFNGFEITTTGTEFQQRVWKELDALGFGETTTYGGLTERLGLPKGHARAVAAAIGANPVLLLRPCHRVIGADGSLTGYAGGLDRKRALLTIEGHENR
jgi:methylated-DNA-[protein]-cysteine S-methyltransferase